MQHLRPDTWFTPTPGSPGMIHGRRQIRRWYQDLANTVRTLRVKTLGTTTEGRPLDALFIADDMDDDSFERIATQRAHSIDDLIHRSPTVDDRSGGRPVVLITAGVHATEIGGPQCMPELIYWLATSDDHVATSIRQNLIAIVVPTLNPDGMDLVERWNHTTLGTDQQGTLPPLLYHRFAGHDNNRDWIYRNLAETRVVMDEIHRRWLPHVTLDQHQMNKFGPRFALPPYADPWDPSVPGCIIAASNALGQTIASDLTLLGFTGVQTGRYFDAWEPSRAIQHYRGGIRILTEAASANLAHPIQISEEQLRATPMPIADRPSSGHPLPWQPGTWTLREIMDYQLAATKSMLKTVANEPGRWLDVQRQALSGGNWSPIRYSIPIGMRHGDRGANWRLGQMLAHADTATINSAGCHAEGTGALGPLATSLLQPTAYPADAGLEPYDLTTHHLPLMMGARVEAVPPHSDQEHAFDDPGIQQGAYVTIDSRSHLAPRFIESALQRERPVWRTSTKHMVEGQLVDAGSWVIESDAIDLDMEESHVTAKVVASLPSGADLIHRRDIVLVNVNDEPSADLGWTRWWLHHQTIPFLETRPEHLTRLTPEPRDTVILLPESGAESLENGVVSSMKEWLAAGGSIIAFGKTARMMTPSLSQGVSTLDGQSHSDIKAPGALLRLVPDRRHPAGMGLDRAIPAMYSKDGAFSIEQGSSATAVASFARRDTVVSGWMAGSEQVGGEAGIIQCRLGKGTLWAFSFRPLFRGQMLVTAPLVHNLLYQPEAKDSAVR